MITLGDALRAERERRELTQCQASAELGVSQPVFCAWERDKSEPKGEYLEDLAWWLDVNLERVFVLLGWGKIQRVAL